MNTKTTLSAATTNLKEDLTMNKVEMKTRRDYANTIAKARKLNYATVLNNSQLKTVKECDKLRDSRFLTQRWNNGEEIVKVMNEIGLYPSDIAICTICVDDPRLVSDHITHYSLPDDITYSSEARQISCSCKFSQSIKGHKRNGTYPKYNNKSYKYLIDLEDLSPLYSILKMEQELNCVGNYRRFLELTYGKEEASNIKIGLKNYKVYGKDSRNTKNSIHRVREEAQRRGIKLTQEMEDMLNILIS